MDRRIARERNRQLRGLARERPSTCRRFVSLAGAVGALLASSFGVGGCTGAATDVPGEHRQQFELGELEASLVLPDDSDISVVSFAITGPLGYARSDQVNVGNSSKLRFRIGDLPIQSGYTIELSATTGFGNACSGSASFNILDNGVTPVSVQLMCMARDDRGDVLVNGEFVSCPLVTSLQAIPAQVLVGHTMDFTAWISHGNSLVAWSATSGSFSTTTGYETTYTCTAQGTHTITATVVGAGPECDDSLTMLVECAVHECGDEVVSAGEECDDGNSDNTDGCTNACKFPVCGDSFVQDGEQCDDGDAIDDNECTNGCLLGSECGDGIEQAGEECDDGNAINTDACTNACEHARCGDGFVYPTTEQCDDGDTVNTDECTNGCKLPYCGDAIVQPATEDCDDGNQDDFDGCTNSCLAILFCPGPISLEAMPAEVFVGFTMDFTAIIGFGTANVEWSGVGAFNPVQGLSTVYTCTTPGIHTITATLIDVDPFCADSATMTVECSSP